jgi:hypothetical protein
MVMKVMTVMLVKIVILASVLVRMAMTMVMVMMMVMVILTVPRRNWSRTAISRFSANAPVFGANVRLCPDDDLSCLHKKLKPSTTRIATYS